MGRTRSKWPAPLITEFAARRFGKIPALRNGHNRVALPVNEADAGRSKAKAPWDLPAPSAGTSSDVPPSNPGRDAA